MTTLDEKVLKAARESWARTHDADRPISAQCIRSGDCDADWEVKIGVAAINRLLASEGTAGVAVKALEWDLKYASTPFGDYLLRTLMSEGVYSYWFEPPRSASLDRNAPSYTTIEAAKTAAQADYEARIRSALVPAPEGGTAATFGHSGKQLWHQLADCARSLLARPPELRGPFAVDEESLRRVAALPPKLSSKPGRAGDPPAPDVAALTSVGERKL